MQDCHAGVFQVIPRSLCLVNRSRLHRPALPVLTAAPPPPAAPFPTVLLRGANDYMLDEMDRSLHDAFCIVKRVLENEQVVAGARGVLWCLVWWCWVGAIRGQVAARWRVRVAPKMGQVKWQFMQVAAVLLPSLHVPAPLPSCFLSPSSPQ